MDSTQGWWYPGQGKAIQGLKHLLGLLPSLHRNPEAAGYQRQQEKMPRRGGPAKQSSPWRRRRPVANRMRGPPPPSPEMSSLHECSAHSYARVPPPSRGFSGSGETAVQTCVARRGCPRPGAVRIGWVVQQHQHTPDRGIRSKRASSCRYHRTWASQWAAGRRRTLESRKISPRGPGRREPMAPVHVGNG